MTVLVITADDLGLDPRRDAGILDAFRRGAITFTSLLVAGPSAREAAARAREAGLPMGLHLDLTETDPCAPAAEVRSLLDGAGKKRGKHGLRAAVAAGEVNLAQVARETGAQLDRFEALTGAPARHVDGHQHAHVVPELVETLAATFARRGVKTTRIPSQGDVEVTDAAAARFYREVSAQAEAARGIYARHGVTTTEGFLGLDTMGEAMSAEALLRGAARHRGARSIELMCHPGYVGATWDDFNQSPAREHELKVLSALPFRELEWLELRGFASLVPQ